MPLQDLVKDDAVDESAEADAEEDAGRAGPCDGVDGSLFWDRVGCAARVGAGFRPTGIPGKAAAKRLKGDGTATGVTGRRVL
jgi:hypothetical protein